MKDSKGNVPGPQQHAEGQQGDKTRERFQEQLREGIPAHDEAQENDGAGRNDRNDDGQRR